MEFDVTDLDVDDRIRKLEARIKGLECETMVNETDSDDLLAECKTIKEIIQADYHRVRKLINRVNNNRYNYKKSLFPILSKLQNEKKVRRSERIQKAEEMIRILSSRNDQFRSIKYKKVKWKILPTGKWSMSDVKAHYQALAEQYPSKKYDLSRLDKIAQLNPTVCYIGQSEDREYVAFCFNYTSKVVLERARVGNAIYIIKDNWKQFAKLTKSELRMRYPSKINRIIHNGDWFGRLQKILQN